MINQITTNLHVPNLGEIIITEQKLWFDSGVLGKI